MVRSDLVLCLECSFSLDYTHRTRIWNMNTILALAFTGDIRAKGKHKTRWYNGDVYMVNIFLVSRFAKTMKDFIKIRALPVQAKFICECVCAFRCVNANHNAIRISFYLPIIIHCNVKWKREKNL